jgi:uncharacterized HAD superfamily protein
MKIQIDTSVLKSYHISVEQYVLLHLFYYKQFDEIKELFGKEKSIDIRNSLTDYFLSTTDTKFTESVISKNKVQKLLGIRSDIINFWEFYNCYPLKVGSRVLRAAGVSSQLAQKHEKKYLAKIKTIEQHQQAINAITAFVSKQKQANKLQYLPGIEVVLNNALWEQWDIFLEDVGVEGKEWNNDTI